MKLVRHVHGKLEPFISGLADLPIEAIKKKLGLEEVAKLSFNENPLGPSPKAIVAMESALKQLHLYPHSAGEELLNKIAQREGLSANQVILSNGADEMIQKVAQTFLEPDDEVLIPEITFGQYMASTHLMGATPILVPMNVDLQTDLQGFLQRINAKTKLIFLCNPNNPTGLVIPPEELKVFIDHVPDHVMVVIDEAYHEYADPTSYSTMISSVKEGKQVLIIRTFSKVYGLAGARVGYGIGSQAVIDALHHVRLPFNVNRIGQVGALASLDDCEHVVKAKAINEVGKTLLYETFEKMGLYYLKSHGNFVYVDTGVDSSILFTQLAERGLIVRNLSGYGLTTSIRISIGTEAEMERFVKVLQELI